MRDAAEADLVADLLRTDQSDSRKGAELDPAADPLGKHHDQNTFTSGPDQPLIDQQEKLIINALAHGRNMGTTVADAMIREPKLCDVTATVGEVRQRTRWAGWATGSSPAPNPCPAPPSRCRPRASAGSP